MSLLQLQAIGNEDIYLNEKPEISSFHYVYCKYLNFSIDNVSIPLNNKAEFGKSNTVSIPMRGHLLSKMYLSITLPALTRVDGTYVSWCDTIGYAIFKTPVELEIDGNIIDRLYPVGMDILNELTVYSKKQGLDRMLLKSDIYRASIYNAEKENTLLIPLEFWFCKDYSLALPILSMSNEIKINFNFIEFENAINYDGAIGANPVQILDSSLILEYIYLDDFVLDQFQKKEHVFLIDQMLYNGDEIIPQNSLNYNTRLAFMTPCKELLIACVEQNSIVNDNYFNYANCISKISLMLNGKHRFNNDYLPEYVFREIFPNNIHSVIPDKYLYVIPFSIKPESKQPEGSINFGRIDEIVLSLQLNNNHSACYLYVFGINYNIVRIKNTGITFEWFNQ